MDLKIFAFIFVVAMRDATLQKAYNGKKAWLTDYTNFPNSSEKLQDLINNVLNGNCSSQTEFDKSFLDVAVSLCNEINSIAGNDEFTFGNAQKLINIMMKYFYLYSYGNDTEKNKFQYCHCPMDHQLLEVVWKRRNELKSINLDSNSDFTASWGNEDFDKANNKLDLPKRYKVFQEAVKQLSSKITIDNRSPYPIEFDYCVWKP